MKTAFNGKRPLLKMTPKYEHLNIPEPLIGSSLNFKHKLMGTNQSQKGFNEDDLQWKTTSNGR